ncbi:alkaline phosphatase D family protein [Kineococcus rhizosphaerae]|uniref:PhoD-like phosphatase n=1 Tax=Kineococcus rhizosphaerae TaxID=559628 RepID=A0A2T0QYV1_9ACTN|nr:alkaline phosphatase D family protein [Kineococcus rhizosphaerae]PRY11708.1 PhoD-like phosphatase [Kineococcus rhizosphaerae]
MPLPLLGPVLRHVDATSATVWVEVAAPGHVHVDVELPDGSTRRGSEPTLSLHGHHFALVVVDGLPTGESLPYGVSQEVDGQEERLWPPVWDWPASRISTPAPGDPVRLAFGSCRRAGDDGEESTRLVGVDALSALAHGIVLDGAEAPDVLLFVGDQVYADDPNPGIVDRLRERNDGRPEGSPEVRDEIGDFEEYTWLYHETWGPDPVRWLMSTVPTCMLLDDHDLRDDWNTSQAWREEVRRRPWWRDRVTGAFASYWVYQHLGNLSPTELAEDRLYRTLRATADDDERDALLDAFAWGADADPSTARWSFTRELGAARLVAIDSRCSRRLEPGARYMTDATEWEWVRARALAPGARHLLLATTLPAFLLHGIHHAEAFDEAVADGRFGARAAGWAEALRQAADLEHWAAFGRSFGQLVDLLGEVGRIPRAPASVLLLSGDVHCSYTAQVRVPGVDPARTVVHQLVMSPFRNPLERGMKVANRLLDRAPVRGLLRGLSLLAGVRGPDVAWRVEHGPWFDNGVTTVVLGPDGAVDVQVDHAGRSQDRPRLRRTLTRRLRTPVVHAPAREPVRDRASV